MSAIAPGSKLSHFEILEKLGEGGMGVVYKARDLRLDRLVAIKVLLAQAVANAEREARFVQEAKAASALNHPNIITVHEIDTAGDVTFIATEYVDGRTLDQLIPRKGLRFTEALKYAVQITDALAAAHSIGIVHRDLKPANIMITGKGLVKVLDFGLAKLIEPVPERSASDATQTMGAHQSEEASIVGTVAYMSPEQAQGKPVDVRSDIFSFGIVLYETLTGRRPFTGETNLSTLAALVSQEPTPARQIVEGLPTELDRIVARCLRKDPGRRFQTMADLHVGLEELKEESDSGRLTGAASLTESRRRVWRWVGTAGLMLIAIAAVWLVKKSAVPAAPAQKVVPVTTYAGSEVQPSFSPDGNQVAFSWGGEKSDNFDIYVKLLGQITPLRLTNDPAADLYPVWSPDGKWIAFERYSSAQLVGPPAGPMGVFMVSPLGGAEQKVSDFPAATQMSWTPDGKWLAVSGNALGIHDSDSNGIVLLPFEGGEPRRITHPMSSAYDTVPSISADGRRLAYSSCNGELLCDIWVQELDSTYAARGGGRRITHQASLIRSVAWSRDARSIVYTGTLSGGRLSYLWRAAIDEQRGPQRLEIAGPNAFSHSISVTGNRLIFSRALTNSDIWRYQLGRSAEPLITSSLDDNNPQFSPDGTRIAFSSSRTGEAMEIWVAHADGSRVVQMTNSLGRHQGSPRWSPDGRWIAFDSQREDGHWDIYVIDAAGGRPRRITFDPSDEHTPAWSHDTKWLYFRSNRTGRAEIWRAPFAGGTPEQVTRNGGNIALESVDGKTLFYTKGSQTPLFAQSLSGGPDERQVLPGVSVRAFVPVEEGIYFIGPRGTNGYPLEFFQFSNGRTRLVTTIPGELDFGLTVSPDRNTFLFSKTDTAGADLMMIENFQ